MGRDLIEIADCKARLLEVLLRRSFRHDPGMGFTLSSGLKSDVYIDVKKTVLSSEGMKLVGCALYEALKDEDIEGIGGLTLGADPIAYSAALVSTLNGKPLDAFVVRKEPKKHGTQQWVEGSLKEGAKVAIVDDVVTTAGSTITAIERARLSGLVVKRVIALVDRQEGGKENLAEKTGCRLESIFTKSDLLELHKRGAR